MSSSEPIDRAQSVAGSVSAQPDRDGFATVFRSHQDWALRLAFLLSGDRDRAEDAVAEAFARMWPHWQRGSIKDDRAYLRRAVINELRSRARRRTVETREASKSTATGRGCPTAEETAMDRHSLMVALARLPQRQRAVIVLRFYEDLTERATADALGMRLGTVKSQTSRALTRLRGSLNEEPA